MMKEISSDVGGERRAFVTGSTGFTGREVVRLLAERAVDTIAHIRPQSTHREEYAARFEELGVRVAYTPWDEEAMAETLAELRPDLVFCLIGTTRARMRRADEPEKQSYEAVDYGLTALLVRACVDAGIDPRFIYISAVGVKPNAMSSYMKARWKAENYVRHSDLRYTIARPSFISGPGRDDSRPLERAGSSVVDVVLEGLGAIGFSRVRDRYHSHTNTELARALVAWGLSEQGEDRILEPRELRADQLP